MGQGRSTVAEHTCGRCTCTWPSSRPLCPGFAYGTTVFAKGHPLRGSGSGPSLLRPTSRRTTIILGKHGAVAETQTFRQLPLDMSVNEKVGGWATGQGNGQCKGPGAAAGRPPGRGVGAHGRETRAGWAGQVEQAPQTKAAGLAFVLCAGKRLDEHEVRPASRAPSASEAGALRSRPSLRREMGKQWGRAGTRTSLQGLKTLPLPQLLRGRDPLHGSPTARDPADPWFEGAGCVGLGSGPGQPGEASEAGGSVLGLHAALLHLSPD
ncbi:not available [Pontoporia blainvillei]|uniref:Not available n=1 Tax=Pontoporia blainvillei TaxID=48723 RepID=A0ABX0S8W8_PONBL|nr:not available [Pontoporia blainvillei]